MLQIWKQFYILMEKSIILPINPHTQSFALQVARTNTRRQIAKRTQLCATPKPI